MKKAVWWAKMRFKLTNLLVIFAMTSLMLQPCFEKAVFATGAIDPSFSEDFESVTSLDSWTNSAPSAWNVTRTNMNNINGISTKVLRTALTGGQTTSPNIKKTFAKPLTNKIEVSLNVYPEVSATYSAGYIFLNNNFTLTLRGTNKTIDLPDGSTISNFTVGKWFNIKFVIDPITGVDVWVDGVIKKTGAPFVGTYSGLNFISFGSYRNFSSTFCYDDIRIGDVAYGEDFESATSLYTWVNSSPTSWTAARATMNNYAGISTNVLRTAIAGGQTVSPNIKKTITDISGKVEVSMWVYPESGTGTGYIYLNPGLFTITLRGSNKAIELPGGVSIATYTLGKWFNIKFVIDPGSGVDVWIDGVLKKSSAPFQAYAPLNSIAFGSYKNYASSFCYDEISVINLAEKNTQAVYYVSPNGSDTNPGTYSAPFNTIEKARTVVSVINSNMTGDIYVYLRAGLYNQSATLNFSQVDSGTNGYDVIYSAYKNEKPLISGGKAIKGWTEVNDGIYKVKLSEALETRQLYVNGVRATRARSEGGLENVVHPAHDTFIGSDGKSHYTAHTDTGFTTTDTFIANYKNISDMEMVFADGWTNSRCAVSSISVANEIATVTMKQTGSVGWKNIDNKGFTSATKPWYYENAYELLDSEGEWYLDRTGAVTNNAADAYTLYYKPRTGENIATAIVFAGNLEQVVNVIGTTLDTPAHDIQFKGLTFKDTTWRDPSIKGFHYDAQNNVVLSAGSNNPSNLLNAVVTLKSAKSILFDRCTFTNLGGNGINMYAGSQDNLVQGCKFEDIAGNGLQVGAYDKYTDPTSENYVNASDTRLILRNNDVKNNYFNKCGVEYRSACAIGAAFPQDMDITHNEIANMPYGGIHIGWQWTSIDSSIGKNNYIEYNYIHDVMRELDDCAAIYTLGSQGSLANQSYINNNYINTSGDHALYFDNGSSYWSSNNNVFDNMQNVNINLSSSDKHNITVTNWYADDGSFWNKGTDCTVSSGILKTNGVWPANAQTIISAAGIIGDYQDIITAPPVITPIAIQSGHVYELVGKFSNKALEVSNSSPDNGAAIDIYSWSSANNQKWTIEDIGSGYYKLTNVNSGNVLDVNGASTADGGGIIQGTWANTANQKWTITAVDGKYSKLNNANSGKTLELDGRSRDNGSATVQWAWGGGNNQLWELKFLY